MTEILFFIAGLVITAVGANQFSKAAVKLATILKVKRIIIGATIVSLATTTPETIVAILSSAKNHTGLALGNALGSPVANIGLILGLVLLFGKINFERNVLRITLILIGLTGISFIIVFFQRTINVLGGILLITAGLFYLWFLAKTTEEPHQPLEDLEITSILKKFIQILQVFFRLISGLGLIVFGGYLLISGGVNLAKILSVSEIFIGLTLIAVGTSLPELALAVVSILKKEVGLSVGNLIGSSILTLTLTLGLAAVISPVKTNASVFYFDFPAVLILSLVFLTAQFLNFNKRILGASFLIFYLSYLILLKVVG